MSADTTIHHRSIHQNWETPSSIFDPINAEFEFTLDACASADNAKCKCFFTEEDDGLVQDWGTNVVWCQPPYRDAAQWTAKAITAARLGATVVMLVPARPGSIWFNELMCHADIRFLAGRITFESACEPAPFPSALAILRPSTEWPSRSDATFTMPTRHRGPRWITVRAETS